MAISKDRAIHVLKKAIEWLGVIAISLPFTINGAQYIATIKHDSNVTSTTVSREDAK